MQKRWTWMILILIAMAALWGCSDDDEDPVQDTRSAFQVIAEAGSAYINSSDCPGVVLAANVEATLDADPNFYTILDVRTGNAGQDFIDGHIAGAINVGLGDIVDGLDAGTIPTDKPFLVVCYSGQSAGHAKIALEMLGYEAYSLKWGMSSWSAATRTPWDSKTIDLPDNDPARNLLTTPEVTANDKPVAGDTPVLTEGKSTVIKDRVIAMLDAGFKGIDYATVAATPGDFYVVNYFGMADYMPGGPNGVPGHIAGAFQYKPRTADAPTESELAWGEYLDTLPLPTDKTIVVYCWTGQTSSQITAYLNMLGYDARSLVYGSNVLFYDSLTGHKWTDAEHNDFYLEYGSNMTPAFATAAALGKTVINNITYKSAEQVNTTLGTDPDFYTILDIRTGGTPAGQDFADAHIAGAINVAMGDVVAGLDAGTIPTDKPFLVVCYSGQSAGHVKIALEMLGYEAYTLKWGMSGWGTTTRGPWDSKTVNATMPNRNLLTSPDTDDNNDDLTWHAFPEFTADIPSRVAGMLTDGFASIPAATVLANPENYFIINYFGETDYMPGGPNGVPGHLEGAFQFTPGSSMGWDEMLAAIPTDMPVVVYCWTGQTSSQVAAYLNLLDYDAYTMSFGSNILFYDDLADGNNGRKWTSYWYQNYDVVTSKSLVAAY